MRVILILAIGLICNACLCQDYNFSAGLTYQPCFYKNYNKNDWNNMPQSYPDNPSNFNGFAIGLTFSRPLNEFWELGGDVLYSDQTQYYKASTSSLSDGMGNTLKYFYNNDLSRNFKMIRFPVYIKYSFELGYDSDLYLSSYIGGQLSLLIDYKDEDYQHNVVNGTILADSLTITTVRTPNHLYQKIWDNTLSPRRYRIVDKDYEYIYNQWLIGVIGGVELSKTVLHNYKFSIGARFGYDFNDSEKLKNYVPLLLGKLNRPKTHNIRTALTFSVSYMFGYY